MATTQYLIGLNQIFEARIESTLSIQDLYEYSYDKSIKQYDNTLTGYEKNPVRELSLTSGYSLRETINLIISEAQIKLENDPDLALTPQEIFTVENSMVPMPDGIEYIDYNIYNNILRKIDKAIQEVLKTILLFDLNKYIVYIPYFLPIEIKELLQRFNKSFQQHHRRIKKFSPEELSNFIHNEVWDIWYKDTDHELVLRVKNTYLELITKQNN